MDQDDDIKPQDPAEVLNEKYGFQYYGVASAIAVQDDSDRGNTWWYRVENLDGSPVAFDVEIIGFCEDPTAHGYCWPDLKVYKLVDFVRRGHVDTRPRPHYNKDV